MKAPDKIYVEVCEDGIFAFPEPPFAESVEYVKADLVKPTPDESKIEGNPAKVTLIPEGLEEEIDNYIENERYFPDDERPIVMEIARHFAEWGANHLRSVTKMVHDGLEEDYE